MLNGRIIRYVFIVFGRREMGIWLTRRCLRERIAQAPDTRETLLCAVPWAENSGSADSKRSAGDSCFVRWQGAFQGEVLERMTADGRQPTRIGFIFPGATLDLQRAVCLGMAAVPY